MTFHSVGVISHLLGTVLYALWALWVYLDAILKSCAWYTVDTLPCKGISEDWL